MCGVFALRGNNQRRKVFSYGIIAMHHFECSQKTWPWQIYVRDFVSIWDSLRVVFAAICKVAVWLNGGHSLAGGYNSYVWNIVYCIWSEQVETDPPSHFNCSCSQPWQTINLTRGLVSSRSSTILPTLLVYQHFSLAVSRCVPGGVGIPSGRWGWISPSGNRKNNVLI